jgi:hypothetical protein
VIESGEIVLGYPDDLGVTPPTATVDANAPGAELLPRTGPNEYSIGRNGTFLVVRQLEQDVTKFETFLTKAAREPGVLAAPLKPGVSREEWVAAKMVGRWKDGTSLVRNPDAPGSLSGAQPDDDFAYGTEDPDGLRCPFGAHIRRANPRDSLEPGSADGVKITNRHRILRIGRSYQSGNARGLMFMCLNADIERQFEFIQQTWVRAPSFHGLENEVDPLVAGPLKPHGQMTIPTVHGPVLLTGFGEFVRVRGASYFFLPGRRAFAFLMAVARRRASYAEAAQ